ncbi:LuxR family transcriptional regulator [Pseudonocardiaceae bacterium YIM PH 21723]|nr:LuxR family transcriptional regulator [Pseudonocardiaceae bacterium YIM PH 21723]
MLDDAGRIEHDTAQGRRWWELIDPDVLRAIAGACVPVPVPTSDGWALVQGQRLWPGGVACTVQPATAWQLLPVLRAWYGLSPRELDVLRAALSGASGKQIARRMARSTHTVHDHFRAIYRKLGVNCRDELLSALVVQAGDRADDDDRGRADGLGRDPVTQV